MKKLVLIALIITLGFSVSLAVDGSNLVTNGISFVLPLGFLKAEKKVQHRNYQNKTNSEKTIEKEFKVAKGKTLTVDLKTGGSLNITGWDKEIVNVKAALEGEDMEKGKIEFEETDNGIRITSNYDGDKENWSGSCDLEIKVPDKFNLSLNTMGGGITLSNINGELNGKTMGGGLNLDHLKGVLKLNTMGGSISLTNSDVDGEVETMGGEVSIKDVKGDVKGHSMGGNVSYSNITRRNGEASNDQVKISSMGGNIDVDKAPSGADLHTMGGSINVNSAKKYIIARTMGGNIKILDLDGSVKASTMAGNVEVNMTSGGDDHGVNLSSLSGDVTLEIPADFSMDVAVTLTYTEGNEGKYKINSDFSLKQDESQEWEKHHGSPRKHITGTGSFNGGKNSVVIETINGNVYLKKH